MIIISYLWILSLFFMTGFMVTDLIVEKNFDESHPIKKWWRKHIIDTDPYDETPEDFNK